PIYQIKIAPAWQGLDFNRNFPFIWAPEGVQSGAGPYPASEPEIRALIAFLTEHPNVSSALSYHTYSGAILRPYSDRADDAMPIDDLWTYQDLGARGTALTGYPNLSVYHGFRYHPRQIIRGAFDDWAYDQLGVFAFTVEIWDMIGAAGIKSRDFIGWLRDHPEEDDLKLLAWNDSQLGEAGFVSWRPFQHPQLGPVEIGGWVERYTFRNPPAQLLLQTIEPITTFALAHARVGPRLELRHCTAEALGEDIFRVQAIVANSGYLPTYGSRRAAEVGAVRPIEVALGLPPGAALLTGELMQAVGQLEGRANKRELWGSNYPTDHLARLEWTLRAPTGGALTISAHAQRAGCAAARLELG
ncbi:MAG: carboxypeptidase, partial [Oscillochloris sp.]|nr:carboxypeptidase [Oscillochloris sp.]